MADFLAIDWEKGQLCGVEAVEGSGQVRIVNCFRLQWPADMDPLNEVKAASEWLKQQLSDHRISAKQVLLTLPREDVVVRHLELPDAPEEELPELVRYQAAAKSTLPLNELHIDYLPLPTRPDSIGRDVLLTTVSNEMVGSILKILEGAGLEALSIGVSSCAAAELVSRVEGGQRLDRSEASLIVSRHDDRVEITMIRNRHLVLLHSTLLFSAEDSNEQQHLQSILTEINRSLIALEKTIHGIQVARIWVLGEQSENQPLISVLQNRFGETVQSLDPFAYSEVSVETDIATGNRALYSGPIGALLGQTAEQISVVDFLNPRKAIVDRDRRALKLSLIAAGVLLLISAVYGYRYWKIADLDSQIAEMKVEIKSLDTSLKKVAPNLVSAELVQKWIDQKVDWLEHTKRLTEAMQGIEQYYLTDLSFSRGLRGSQGTINATGAAKSRGDVERLYAKISAVTGFEIRPNPITRNGRDREYPYEFHLEVDLKPVQEKTKQTTSGAAGGNS